ncbi:hypothetical protein ACL7TT_18230 [Microbulbifer sp. 2304DJ12-6]|uniref:hypothetical protein n=1 Tax=Microbulbifer sp. 2304DJ12-6 TaxID=3233340 RepID=UPI0039B0EAE6
MLQTLRRPEALLLMLAVSMPFSFSVWNTLLNNFVIEKVAFTGADIGPLQSVREIPGFLAFLMVFVLFWIREQRLALLSLIATGVGVMLTGFYPSLAGRLLTTLLMSTGFHVYETLQASLALQWFPKQTSAIWMGRMVAAGSFAALMAYGLVWGLMNLADLGYTWLYMIGGDTTVAIALMAWLLFPQFP